MDAVLAIIAEREAASGQKVTKSDVFAIVEELEATEAVEDKQEEEQQQEDSASRSTSSRASSCGASDSGIGTEPSEVGTPFEEKQQHEDLKANLWQKKRQ